MAIKLHPNVNLICTKFIYSNFKGMRQIYVIQLILKKKRLCIKELQNNNNVLLAIARSGYLEVNFFIISQLLEYTGTLINSFVPEEVRQPSDK